MSGTARVVNDVTKLNPVPVFAIATPHSVAEVQAAIASTTLPLSVGGGHFSMGGQTASPGSLHLDMRRLNQVLWFSPLEKIIRVQAGIRWCDIQKFVDPHGLSVKIMQTYANFTVGGSLSVNVHGRYIGLGPVVLSVRSISLILANGERVEASPVHNPRLFYAAIGGYGAIGVIVEVELELTDNVRVARSSIKLPLTKYVAYFKESVRNSPKSVFHNADIYPPHYAKVRAVTWSQTKRAVTTADRLQPHRKLYALHKYVMWVITENLSGRWRREHIIDPLVFLTKPVHWRNYEAGYDVAELEPPSREHRTYVLQEYFAPVDKLDEFVPKAAEILRRHRVNVVNISIRHAIGDQNCVMAWARGETFAFVLYYKQRTRDSARGRVAVWTRELIDAALSAGGTYYLPYQPHATHEQFHRAYPRAGELFALKRQIDPEYRLRNTLWDKYYQPTLVEGNPVTATSRSSSDTTSSEFVAVFSDERWSDAFYLFLQNIYRLYPEDRFHWLIKQACEKHSTDEEIYRYIHDQLPTIKTRFSALTYALPSLFKQKQEMLRQTLELLGDRKQVDGYVEIGSTGRYASVLRKKIDMSGALIFINDVAPTNSPVDIAERGRISKLGTFVPLSDYDPITSSAIPDSSVDLVSVYIGLHHIAPEKLRPFIASVARIMRPGGMLILRDHDVKTPVMFHFVSLVHTVFNAGLGVSWESNQKELRFFVSVDEWVTRLKEFGLIDTGKRLLQAHDPSDNVLMSFIKT